MERNLGAAGCKWIAEDQYCCWHLMVNGKHVCQQYGELNTHWDGQAIRHQQCGNDAEKVIRFKSKREK